MTGAAAETMTRAVRVLPEQDWRARAAAYRARVDALVQPYLEHRAAGTRHPVLDFLFTYYSYRPAQLRRWHPGFGVALDNAAEYAGYRGYHRLTAAAPATDSAIAAACTADPAFLHRRRDTVEYIAKLLRATSSRAAHLSCFGLHEWAMVYRSDEVRHEQVPLRLGRAGTDAVVESLPLRCTHFDAFRFFTPDAVTRNAEPLTRDDQPLREQPGCLHANMDLYKWGYKLIPLIDAELLLECFELARDARELDMRASPYDLTAYGYAPVAIETPGGRADYARHQSRLAERAAPLRERLLDATEFLLRAASR